MRRLTCILLASACVLLAGFERKPRVILRVHDQTEEDKSGKFAIPAVREHHPNVRMFVSKMPLISERDVKSIYVYDSGGGKKGVAFKLDRHGTVSLSATSAQRLGKLFFVFMNGRNIAELLVDRHVSDGVLNVPHGFTDAEIALLKKEFAEIGVNKRLSNKQKKKLAED